MEMVMVMVVMVMVAVVMVVSVMVVVSGKFSVPKKGVGVRGLYIGIVIHLYTPSPPSLVLVL